MEEIQFNYNMKQIIIIIILGLIAIISISFNINIYVEKKVEVIKQEAREEGRSSIFQEIGDLVRQGQRQINIPYTFKNEAGEEQTVNVPLMPILPQ